MSIDGTSGPDTLTGTLGDDIINALGGRDTINATQGADFIDGGSNLSDRINVIMADASRFADAATGSRTYTFSNGYMSSSAGGLDTSFVNVERVVIELAGTGDFGDSIDASAHSGTYFLDLRLGNGDDVVTGGAGDEYVHTRGGINVVDTGAGNDTVATRFDLGLGTTMLVTGSGNLVQTWQNGIATNTVTNAETIAAGNDIDAAFLVDGLTRTIDASAYAGDAQLQLWDHNGDDVLIGSARADIFVNLFNATVGDDTYTGNGGADIYDYTVAVNALNHDVITDFDSDDLIDFQFNDGIFLPGQLLCNQWIGAAAFSEVAGQYRYTLAGTDTLIQIDTDGDAIADRTLTLANGHFVIAETLAGSNQLRLAGLVLDGTAGNDTLTGSAGDDIISPNGGVDTVNAGDGDDTVVVSAIPGPGTVLDGGADYDTLELRAPYALPSPLGTTISGYILTPAPGIGVTLAGFEALQFNSTAGTQLWAAILSPVINGGLLNLTGGAGRDILLDIVFTPGSYLMPAFNLTNWTSNILDTNSDFVSLYVNPTSTGDFILTAREGLASTQQLRGALGNDVLNGSSGSEFLVATGGIDRLYGNGGSDNLIVENLYTGNGPATTFTFAGDVLDGGDGVDALTIGGAVNLTQATISNVEWLQLEPVFAAPNPGSTGIPYSTLTISAAQAMSGFAPNLYLFGAGTVDVQVDAGQSVNLSGWQFDPAAAISVAITGTSGNETITGTSGGDVINGRGGVDTINAGDGDDAIVIDTQPGSGTIYNGGNGFDTLVVTRGSSSISSGLGFLTQYQAIYPTTLSSIEAVTYLSNPGDIMSLVVLEPQRAGSGLTTVIGGAGRDLLYDLVFSAGTYTMPEMTLLNWNTNVSDPNSDFIVLLASGVGNYVLNARDNFGAPQVLQGNSGNDTLNGGNGMDLLYGRGGINILHGNGGSDLLYAENTTPFGGGETTLTFAGNLFDGGSEDDSLLVGGRVDFQGTLVSIERIFLQNASVAVPGGTGLATAYLILTGSTALTLSSTTQVNGVGTIVINLDAGSTNFDISGWTSNLVGTPAIFGNGNTLNIQVQGSSGDDTIRDTEASDTLYGNDGSDTIYANGGNDSVRGGGGADTLYGGDGNDFLMGGFNNQPTQPQPGDLGDYMDGGAGNDRLHGGDGDDILFGGSGDDRLRGDAGNDTIDGGDGYDMLGYNFSTSSTGVTLDASAIHLGSDVQAMADGSGGVDLVSNVDWISLAGSTANDVLIGSTTMFDELIGYGGDDILIGGSNDDYLEGGSGNDTMQGGMGFDHAGYFTGKVAGYSVVSTGPNQWQVTDIDLSDGNDGTDILTSIEQLDFADGTTILEFAPTTADGSTSGNEDSVINGALSGTDPDGDTLTYALVSGPTHGTLVLAPNGTFSYTPNANYFGPDSFQFRANDGTFNSNVSTFNLNVAAVADAATIGGQTTGSVIEGTIAGAPAGTVSGALTVSDPDGPTQFATQLAIGTYGSFALQADGTWTYTLAETSNATQALNIGSNVTDSFTVASDDGTTSLVVITIAGANDAAVIGGQTTGTVQEAATLGLASQISGALTVSDVDNQPQFLAATLTGLYGTLTIDAAGAWRYSLDNANPIVDGLSTGQSLTDTIAVQSADGTTQNIAIAIAGANEVRTGTAGADTLFATAGNDTIDGLKGIDTASYALVTSGVTVSLAITGSQNTIGGGTDTLIGIENLTGTARNDILTGDGFANELFGGDGDDRLDGGNGNDRLDGGNGNDTVSFASSTSKVTANLAAGSASGAGNDTLVSIENVIGSAFGDTLIGSAGANALSGGTGNDRITGAAGADILSGGVGNDTFVYAAVSDSAGVLHDLIVDFDGAGVAGGDVFDFSAIDPIPGGRDNAFVWGATNATARGVWYEYDAANNVTHIYADTDGIVATFEMVIDVAGSMPFTNTDFIL